MKFSLISDMHINHPQPKTPYSLLEEIVVVAGDTSNGLEGFRFLNKLERQGRTILAVDGNHEHYSNRTQGRHASETTKRFQEEYPSEREVEGVKFILRNGWYPVVNEQAWISYMNDSYNTMLSGPEATELARDDAIFIESRLNECREAGAKAVVVTHTAPCFETLDPRYAGHWSNDWYWNPMCRALLKDYADTIHVWCHGHTHQSQDKVVDGVRVVCNPRGYPGENPNWKPQTIVI